MQLIIFNKIIFHNAEESHPPPAKRKKTPKMLDGTFYTIHAEKDNKVEAKCMLCGHIVKGNLGSTGNFKSHFSRKHKDRASDLEDYLISIHTFQANSRSSNVSRKEVHIF